MMGKHTTRERRTVGLVVAASVALGVALVVSVFQLSKGQFALGVIGGQAIGVVLVWREATVGERPDTLTFTGKRTYRTARTGKRMTRTAARLTRRWCA